MNVTKNYKVLNVIIEGVASMEIIRRAAIFSKDIQEEAKTKGDTSIIIEGAKKMDNLYNISLAKSKIDNVKFLMLKI
jgi:hypothetical protein